MKRPIAPGAVTLALVALGLFAGVERGRAHKPITSPYTYNDDVFPILRDRCGRCHVSGGVAPMSLMTHAGAVPWGESIRTEILAGQMPPGGVDDAPGRFRNAATLSPREMNQLLTWVTGGTPVGNAGKEPPPVMHERVWPLGTPDLVLPLPTEVIVGADTREQTSEFIVSTGLTGRRWARAVDLLPDNATMVRAATIAVRSPSPAGPGATVERTLALWLPGEEPYALDTGLGFELPAAAELVVRVLYRKTWEYERQALRDRSTIGIYFGPDPATAVESVSLSPEAGVVVAAGRLVFRRTLADDVRALAIYPESGWHGTTVRVTATRPDGTRTDLMAFHPRPDWAHRYWFREPVVLPRGSTVEVTAARDDEMPLLPLSLSPASGAAPDLTSIRLTMNVVR